VKKHSTEQIIRELCEGEALAAQGKTVAAICPVCEVLLTSAARLHAGPPPR
jgi:hypothetical protein